MRRTFKYRIYANQETLAKAENWIELCRVLYNCALAERIYAYKMCRLNLREFDQFYEIPQMRKENPEYLLVNAQTMREVIKRVDRAYRYFFSQIKRGKKVGLPRFKSHGRYSSFTLEQNGWTLDGRYLTIRNVGTFKIKLSRQIVGNIKTVTICRLFTKR